MKSQERIFDTLQLIGLFLGVLLSVVLIFVTDNPIGSAILGLGVAILFQLYDMQRRQSASEEKILQATALSRKLYQDDWLYKHIQQIVDNYLLVKDGWFDLFKNRANDAVIECRNTLTSMAEGYMLAESRGRFAFGAEGFTRAEKIVKAVTAGEVGYWKSTYGEKYFQVNVAAMKHGVRIIRVFIQPQKILDEIVDILKNQRDAGVEVYTALPEELPRELNEDYLIMDDRVCVRMELAGDRHAREERISIDEVEVERMVKRFDMLLRHARKLDGVVDSSKE